MTSLAIPEEERPRERLFSHGPAALSLQELLAVLLRTGCSSRSVLAVAEDLIRDFGGLEGLARITSAELLSVKGLGKAKAATLLASLELGRRLRAGAVEEGQPGWRSRLAWWAADLASETREYVVALYLDDRERFLGEDRLSDGGLSGAYLDVSYLLRRAVRHETSRVVLLHNHPDGSLAGSAEDRALTEALRRRLELLDMKLAGHYVVAKGEFRPLAGSCL